MATQERIEKQLMDAAAGINSLYMANSDHGIVVNPQVLEAGLHALASLPDEEIKKLVEELKK